MKKLCKSLSVVLLIAVLVNMVGCAKSEKLSSIEKIKRDGYITMSTNSDFEPFEFKDGNEIVGIDIDISRKIAEKLGVELKINDVAFDAVIFELKNRSCNFVAAGLTYDIDKARSVDFSIPYINATQNIIVLKESNITGLNDLKNKKVGVQLGTTSDSYCTESNLNIETVRFNKSMDAISDLISGQIDAVMVDNFAANKFVNKNSEKIKKLDETITGETYSIAVKKGDSELLDFINSAIEELRSTGELDNIVNKYIA